MKIIKLITKILLAAFLTMAGITHFTNPDFFLDIMPPYLPWHRPIVYISGVCEIVIGVGLLIPALTRQAAWGAIALFIAVFPANIYLYQNYKEIERFKDDPHTFHLIRLPLQGVLILWAYWYTRKPVTTESNPTIDAGDEKDA